MYSNSEVPILILTYNRIDTLRVLLDVLRVHRPKNLFIASNAPNPNNPSDIKKIVEISSFLLETIDWDCNIETLFRKKHMNCSDSLADSISWFFKQVEMGIIFEDDCIPDISFFSYCHFLLNEYKDDKRIMGISGTNFFPEKKDEIFFTAGGGSIWGWATWRRSWDLYNHNIMNDDVMKLNYQGVFKFKKGLYRMIYKSYSGLYDKSDNWEWDMRWGYAVLLNHGLFINPKKNLITNIGIHGTHGDVKEVINKDKQTFNIDNLILPKYFIPNYEYEVKVLNKYMPISFGPKRMLAHIIGSIGLYDFFIKFYKKYKK